ncbi:dUTPase [Arthrobacter sp. AQ5-06]|nr:dUTPase [Arthrobacter sp. AQ5-06]
MATDYDAPRKSEEDLTEESLQDLKTRRSDIPTAAVDVDESDLATGYEFPGADLSGEELLVLVVPPLADEFTCSSCFLVRHRSQIAREKDGRFFCKECEA